MHAERPESRASITERTCRKPDTILVKFCQVFCQVFSLYNRYYYYVLS